MNINVAADEWCPELNLEANTTTTVTFIDEDLDSVELVVIANTGRVRWTCNGSEPGEDAGWYVPRDGVDQRIVDRPASDSPTVSTVIKLWSSGSATACVQRVP